MSRDLLLGVAEARRFAILRVDAKEPHPAESGIRHIIKKRLDVAGAWTEANGKRMLALISVRASGLWQDFWRWRDLGDVEAWHGRQRGETRSRFRGRPCACPKEVKPATRLAS